MQEAVSLVFTAINALPADSLTGASQISFAVAAVLFVYTLLNVSKRDRASRLTWVPSLLVVPAAVLGIGFMFSSAAPGDVRALGMLFMAFDLAWSGLVGGVLASLWIGIAQRRFDGGSGIAGDVRAALAALPRALDVAPIHAVVYLIVTAGIQVIVPGVIYAIAYAYTDLTAYFEPEQRSLRRSADLARGQKVKLFVVQFVPYFCVVLPVAIEGVSRHGLGNYAVRLVMDPRMDSYFAHAVSASVWTLAGAAVAMILLVSYRDRVSREQPAAP
jgi:hypothetical protein